MSAITEAPPSASPDPAIEDDRLIREFLAGERRAFDALLLRHRDVVHALARRYTRNGADAADLAQRAFLKAFEAARRAFDSRAPGLLPFRSWLLRIAVNLAKNHVRDARRRPQVALDAVGELAIGAPTALQSLERRESENRVRAAVVILPKREREVFTLRLDAGLPFAEIGEILGITENNAKVSFHHAFKRLKAALDAADEVPS